MSVSSYSIKLAKATVITLFIFCIAALLVCLKGCDSFIAGKWKEGLWYFLPGVASLPIYYMISSALYDIFCSKSDDQKALNLYLTLSFYFTVAYWGFLLYASLNIGVYALFPSFYSKFCFIFSTLVVILPVFMIVKLSGWLDALLFLKEKRRWKKMISASNLQIQYYGDFFQQEGAVALVLGNGFDLDLGYDMTYEGFAKSNFWPFKGNTDSSTLGGYLNGRVKKGWYDLEKGLYDFASIANFKVSIKDDFELLYASLYDYLRSKNDCSLNENSCAFCLLQMLMYTGRNCKIFSFNYTDLLKIIGRSRNILRRIVGLPQSTCLESPKTFNVTNVHGQLNSHNIIVGTRDFPKDIGNKSMGDWSFLSKATNPDYTSSQITGKLGDYEIVILFGHSLSFNDFPYFKEFFEGIINGTTKCKYLIMYTKDAESASLLDRNIKDLCDGLNLMDFKNKCNYIVVHTDIPIGENNSHWRVIYSIMGKKSHQSSRTVYI